MPPLDRAPLDRQGLLALAGRRFGELPLPDYNALVRFRSLSEAEFSAFEAEGFDRDLETGATTVNSEKQRNARARLLALALCGEDGAPLFTAADVPLIETWDINLVLPIYDAVRDFTGLTGMIARRKAQDAKEKN